MQQLNAVLLLVALSIHRTLSSPLPTRCHTKCPAGYHKGESSTECPLDEIICRQCEDGTYMDIENVAEGCLPHRPCGNNEETIVIGDTTIDYQCRCLEGYFKSYEGSCRPWSSCIEGEGVSSKGSPTRDTQCKPCVDETYSNVDSSTAECMQHTKCEDNGQKTLHDGTPETDTICGPGSTLPPIYELHTDAKKSTNRRHTNHEVASPTNPDFVDGSKPPVTVIVLGVIATILGIVVVLLFCYVLKRCSSRNQRQDNVKQNGIGSVVEGAEIDRANDRSNGEINKEMSSQGNALTDRECTRIYNDNRPVYNIHLHTENQTLISGRREENHNKKDELGETGNKKEHGDQGDEKVASGIEETDKNVDKDNSASTDVIVCQATEDTKGTDGVNELDKDKRASTEVIVWQATEDSKGTDGVNELSPLLEIPAEQGHHGGHGDGGTAECEKDRLKSADTVERQSPIKNRQ